MRVLLLKVNSQLVESNIGLCFSPYYTLVYLTDK